MRLKQLTLNNFCVYRGEQTIYLSPSKSTGRRRPIVLIGGINGGGKTSILDSIQLVLYGNRATCSKKSDKPYEQFLRESINRSVSAAEGAAIRLSFEYSSDGKQDIYEVQRSWGLKASRIKESVNVTRNGMFDRWLSDNWSQQVEDLLPQGISQLCFFDAEKIRFLAEDSTSDTNLGVAIKALLGLDLAERLIADANVMAARIAKRTRSCNETVELAKLECELAHNESSILKLNQSLAALENQRLITRNQLAEVEHEFESVGGVLWENRQRRQQELSNAEGRLSAISAQLVELASGELPLALNRKLLDGLRNRVISNQTATEQRIVGAILEKRDKLLVRSLRAKKVPADWITLVSELLDSDRAERVDSVMPVHDTGLSSAANSLLLGLASNALPTRISNAADIASQYEKTQREIEDLQRALAATPNESNVKETAELLKIKAKELAVLDQQAATLESSLAEERQLRLSLDVRAKKLRKQFADAEIANEEDARLLKLLERTQETMGSFLERATDRKIGRLAEFITESFRFLLRKKALVERVIIDPKTFSIQLEDSSGHRISKQQLSEGEKQIFAISVLWGLSRASTRPLPAVVDTPMGRLDAEHRSSIIDRYFPNASHQVIILSTDTEVDETAYEKLLPNIDHSYRLEYDDVNKCTTVVDGYFWQTSSI